VLKLEGAFFEIDLKIKDTRRKDRQRDRELSKGFVSIQGTRWFPARCCGVLKRFSIDFTNANES
jgi:hypothetical protein